MSGAAVTNAELVLTTSRFLLVAGRSFGFAPVDGLFALRTELGFGGMLTRASLIPRGEVRSVTRANLWPLIHGGVWVGVGATALVSAWLGIAIEGSAWSEQFVYENQTVGDIGFVRILPSLNLRLSL